MKKNAQKVLVKKYLATAIAFDLIIVDQVTKYVARNYLDEPLEILPFFKFVFVENTGVAFSFPVPSIATILLATCVVLYLVYQLVTQNLPYWVKMAYSLILAGAAGNLIDRLLYGAVTDFLSFWSFPIFNLADTWITLGVLCFLISEMKKN